MRKVVRSLSFGTRTKKAAAEPPLSSANPSTESAPPDVSAGGGEKKLRRALSFGGKRHKPAAEAAVVPPAAFAAEIAQFNDDKPREALKALGLFGESRRWPAATWLHRTPGLDMGILGELLGRPDQVPLMRAYIQRLNLKGLNLERAMRLLLSGFRLPGEAQKIDRILEAFAQHWHATTLGESAAAGSSAADAAAPTGMSCDTAYIVCFALIMLNTDLHNPAIKKGRKMTLESFRSNLRGQGANGGDLPAEWLAQLYDGIAKNEIKLKGGGRTSGGDSAAIVPGLTMEALNRLRARFKAVVWLVVASLRMQRLAQEAKEEAEGSLTPSKADAKTHSNGAVSSSSASPPAAAAAVVRRQLSKLLSPRSSGRSKRMTPQTPQEQGGSAGSMLGRMRGHRRGHSWSGPLQAISDPLAQTLDGIQGSPARVSNGVGGVAHTLRVRQAEWKRRVIVVVVTLQVVSSIPTRRPAFRLHTTTAGRWCARSDLAGPAQSADTQSPWVDERWWWVDASSRFIMVGWQVAADADLARRSDDRRQWSGVELSYWRRRQQHQSGGRDSTGGGGMRLMRHPSTWSRRPRKLRKSDAAASDGGGSTPSSTPQKAEKKESASSAVAAAPPAMGDRVRFTSGGEEAIVQYITSKGTLDLKMVGSGEVVYGVASNGVSVVS